VASVVPMPRLRLHASKETTQMATIDSNELTCVLNSYEQKETILQLPSGTSELGQRNEVEETRDKITHIEAWHRSVIGTVTRVRYGSYNNFPACLICMRFTFRYSKDLLRFKKAEISVNFENRPSQTLNQNKDPAVQAFSPRKIYGKPTEEAKKFTYEVKLQASVSVGPASIGPELSVSKESAFKEEHQLEIIGLDKSKRRRNFSHAVIWTVTEDKLHSSGIPDELNVAVIVGHDGDFQAEVNVTLDTPVMSGLYSNVWARDEPVLFVPPISKGDPLRSDRFDTFTEDDWRSIAPYWNENQVKPLLLPSNPKSLTWRCRISWYLAFQNDRLHTHFT